MSDELTCPACTRTKLAKNDFCSKSCFLNSKRVTLECAWCHGKFVVLKCYADRNRRFCSRRCSALHRHSTVPSAQVEVSCAWCEKRSKRPRSTIRAHANCFCNRTCYAAFHSHNVIEQECASSDCTNKVKTTLNNPHDRYCSRECYKRSYDPANFDVRFKTGTYTSNKAGEVRYDSSYELRRFKELDYDRAVITWGRCVDKIPWTDVDGLTHFYNPDLTIMYDNGLTVVEEIKGYVNVQTQRKIEAAQAHYGSQKNVEFRVIFERDLDRIESILEYYDNQLGTFHRVTYDSIWMKVARLFAKRSTCCRLQVGAVFVDQRNERILCLGYNGSYAGGPNGCDSLVPGACGCTHAEINAVSHASEALDGCTVYVSTSPCLMCAKTLITRRVSRVVYLQKYRDAAGVCLLRNAGIAVDRYQDLVDYSNA